MFAIRFQEGENLDPNATAQKTHLNIQNRKKSGDLLANSMVLTSADKKSVVVDFLVSDKDMLEHNIWRYFKLNGGLVSYQIQTDREKLLKEITRADLPMPNFK
jgi:hypothetical protein